MYVCQYYNIHVVYTSLCHKLPISIRTRSAPTTAMPQCVWEGEGDLTAQWRQRYRPVTRWLPVGFGINQGTPDIGRGNLLPWVSLEVAGWLFGGSWDRELAEFWALCVFFVWWERAGKEFQMLMLQKTLPNSEKWFYRTKSWKQKASSIGDSTILSSVWKERPWKRSLFSKNLSTFHG